MNPNSKKRVSTTGQSLPAQQASETPQAVTLGESSSDGAAAAFELGVPGRGGEATSSHVGGY